MDLWTVDAFADRPFTGNPAAVCWLDEPRDDAWHRSVASEMNLAETAFLTPRPDGFGLRWFTPEVEVDLCGHATVASAQFLWESGRLASDAKATFHTRSGQLTAEREGEWIVLDFPSTPPVAAPMPAGVLEALGATAAIWTGKTPFDLFVVLPDAAMVRALAPDFGGLLPAGGRGVIVSGPGDQPGLDFISRFFAPAVGINEDPVTGSAHCALAPYWADRLGRSRLVGYQASRRGGTVRVEVLGNRVRLAGRASTILRGTIQV